MFTLLIGGVTMPSPDLESLDVGYDDLDSENSGRGEETGIMIRERIRANVRKYPMKWSALKGTEFVTLTTAIAAEQFSVTILDPISGSDQTFTMYAGSRASRCIMPAANYADSVFSLSVQFIEC
jgi:hypothetical protein